jgi:hypothetical protein
MKCVVVPEGRSRIAQRFSVGTTHRKMVSPEGTAELTRRFSRPSGTCWLGRPHPTLKRWASFIHPFGMSAEQLR